MNPEPLFGIFAYHTLDGVGYQLGIGLDIGAQIAGPFGFNGLSDMDG